MKKIKLVCIVEDEPLHLFNTKKLLNLTGLVENYLTYKNGKEAYDKLKIIFMAKEKLPEVIFLDLNMPIWDGWQFLDKFTKIPIKDKVTIYILSSSNNPFDIKKAEKYNLKKNYLVKPVALEQLRGLLDKSIQH